MRVLILVDNLTHPDARADLAGLCAYLDSRRIQLRVCQLRGSPALETDTPRFESATAALDDVAILHARFRLDLRAAWRLRDLLKREQIELVHALEPRAVQIAGLAGWLAGIPVAATIYHADPARDRIRELAQRLIWRIGLWGVTEFVVPYESVGRGLTAILNHAVAAEVIGPGHRPPENLPDRAALDLPDGLLVAALFPDAEPNLDRCDWALATMRHLLRRQPSAHLLILGQGAYIGGLQKAASMYRPGLPLLWRSDPTSYWQHIAAADVYADFATDNRLQEGLILAGMLGKPIVAPRVPAVSDIIEPNVAGLLVEPENAAEFSAQINRLVQYEGLAGRLSRVAQRRCNERFSVEAQSNAFMQMYEAAVYATR